MTRCEIIILNIKHFTIFMPLTYQINIKFAEKSTMGRVEIEAYYQRVDQLHKLSQRIARHTELKQILHEILMAMLELTHADGGTLYSLTGDDHMQVDCGDISEPGPSYLRHMATYVSMMVEKEVIKNVYEDNRFERKSYDKVEDHTEKNPVSLIALPLVNSEQICIGVIQLVRKGVEGKSRQFEDDEIHLANMLAGQSSMTLYNAVLRADLDKLFESFVRVIAAAVDDKSQYTGGHCKRVPQLALMIADAAAKESSGPLKYFSMNPEQRREMKLAALLHDCGKITTPVHIIDKATKLEAIFDRINVVDLRFEMLARDEKIRLLEQKVKDLENGCFDEEKYIWNEKKYQLLLRRFGEEKSFLRFANTGSEFMRPEDQERVRELAKRTWRDLDDKVVPLLSDDEVKNLTVGRGTLTDDERKIINHHSEMTIKMLKELHLPKDLMRIPEIAGGHHEKMDGTGYPNGLTREDMSWEARMMGIADIFEALTAPDRPYKKGKTLSEALRILGFMRKDNHIDEDIFDLFIDQKIYMQYAQSYMNPDQIDVVDESKIPGYVLPEDRIPAIPAGARISFTKKKVA